MFLEAERGREAGGGGEKIGVRGGKIGVRGRKESHILEIIIKLRFRNQLQPTIKHTRFVTKTFS